MAGNWNLIKVGADLYSSFDEPTKEKSSKVKMGGIIHGPFAQMRNVRFHRKFFALLNLAFDYWEPGEISSAYGVPEKNFNRFHLRH